MTPESRRRVTLRLHLGSEHALANWLDTPDPEDVHAHEHEGPGTIRNHSVLNLSYDPYAAIRVWQEGQDLV